MKLPCERLREVRRNGIFREFTQVEKIEFGLGFVRSFLYLLADRVRKAPCPNCCLRAKVLVSALRQKRTENRKSWQDTGNDTIAELEVNSENCKNTILEYGRKEPLEPILLGFRVLSGKACLDHFYVTRME